MAFRVPFKVTNSGFELYDEYGKKSVYAWKSRDHPIRLRKTLSEIDSRFDFSIKGAVTNIPIIVFKDESCILSCYSNDGTRELCDEDLIWMVEIPRTIGYNLVKEGAYKWWFSEI